MGRRLDYRHADGSRRVSSQPFDWVLLRCGCDTRRPPQLSNPDRWWCCGAWQKKT